MLHAIEEIHRIARELRREKTELPATSIACLSSETQLVHTDVWQTAGSIDEDKQAMTGGS